MHHNNTRSFFPLQYFFRLSDSVMTAAGHRLILVITGRFTKLVRAIPMDGASAMYCSSVVLDYCVAAYGPPDRVLSDEGPSIPTTSVARLATCSPSSRG